MSPNVGPDWEWVGGRGYVCAVVCLDRVACWARWDEQHGLVPSYAQALRAVPR